jgi:hypothetical protein
VVNEELFRYLPGKTAKTHRNEIIACVSPKCKDHPGTSSHCNFQNMSMLYRTKSNSQSSTSPFQRRRIATSLARQRRVARGDDLPIRYIVFPLYMEMNMATKCLLQGYAKLMYFRNVMAL